ncbi:Capsule biosynthesis CapC [Altererythrobacter xiamenensis]|uniref:Capsule biosynthesis CapC n=1 Tax=Altererythrobacter xiamenensis TaxID=1316679 RepID=A0A1Y6EQH3_9SPHN|nr:poly-gamma-glutamate biosynthesis protein PgsC/CapC [Altererythrobacter xiamenensis]SMQ64529.1 Capsule biosynthesis CapC [Altererythrobacter xiamenensis]
MELLPITIFPEGGLVSSIITTVWVGVFVLCFFNLRFGWVLSGLVVPGYLVPLVIVKPAAAVVIVIEAVLAYALVWLFSEKLSRGRFPSLFGRDRFMGLILASIIVRLTMDGLVLPEFAGWMEENFDRRIDWEDNLQSFGLVIISLLANQFWKPGLARGLVAAVVTIGLTWLIVRYGLMELTNFRISGVSYLYEGIASSILASPKAYIILTLTAMLASHVNVKYGWDFSGILIPALIALQWYQPSKILTSFAEAIAIYCIARLILKLPMMANVTMEGGRKLLLFFNISFAWKMAVGWLIVWQGLDVKTTDFYGFGYLLSTLIAIKAHDKNIFPRLARSTLQVSLMGAVFGNIVGFTLSAAATRTPWAAGPDASATSNSVDPRFGSLVVEAIGDAHARKVRQEAQPLTPRSAEALGDLVELFEAGAPVGAPGFDMEADGWRVVQLNGGRIAIARADGAGHELLVYDPASTRNLAIVLPDPTASVGLGTAAISLQQNQNASWLVIGAPAPASAIRSTGVVEAFANASNHPQIVIGASAEDAPSQVQFESAAAVAADIAGLRKAIPGLDVGIRVAARTGDGDRGLLALNPRSLLHIASRSAPLAPLSLARACRLPKGGEQAAGWSEVEQLAFMRYEVAAPLVAVARDDDTPFLARAAARQAGFELLGCRLAGRPHWALYSPDRAEGFVFLAKGEEPKRAVLGYRSEDSLLPLRVGAAIHRNWEGDALFVANRSDSLLRSPHSTVDVVWQEWVRQQEGIDNPLTFQLRARPKEAAGLRRSIDLVLVPDRLGEPPEGFGDLVSSMRSAGLRPVVADGSREYAGLEARPAMAMRYFNGTSGRRYAFGWLTMSEGGAK